MSNKEATQETNRDGLKIRRVEEDAPVVVNKPRKMKLLKPKRVQPKGDNPANPALLVFPTDKTGITSGLKKELIRAASRIGSDAEVLKLIDETLRILRGHMQARYKENIKSPALKQRVDTKGTLPTSKEELAPQGSLDGQETVSYDDMLAALKEAGVKADSKKKNDVEAAYATLGTK